MSPPARVLIFDTETTGLPKNQRQIALLAPNNWPDIVSISWSLYYGTTRQKHVHYIIKPDGWEIPAEATSIHGISDAKARTEGSPLLTVLEAFRTDLESADRVIAHNLDFDKNVVLGVFKWRLGKEIVWPHAADVCSMRKSETQLCLPIRPGGRRTPSGFKSPKLDELWVATFGSEAPPGAHGASRDVEVLEKICLQRWQDELFFLGPTNKKREREWLAPQKE